MGWIKLDRRLLNNPIVCKDADTLAIWVWLLLHAKWQKEDVNFGGERITLNPGQLIIQRKKISEQLNVSDSKVYRTMKCFENEQQIEQLTKPQGTLITILAWNKYQRDEQLNEQQMNNEVNNERTTSEQQVNNLLLYKKYKNNNNINNIQKQKEEARKVVSLDVVEEKIKGLKERQKAANEKRGIVEEC